MVRKYPHTATLSWYSSQTVDTYGVPVFGTLNTVLVTCDIQPVGAQYIVGEGGALLNYSYNIYAQRFSGDSSVPKDAKLTFFSTDHIMVQLFAYQKHVEIKC